MEYLENTTINRDIVLDFFLVLSRMEFALKVTNYAFDNGNGVKPNWDRFASDIKDRFNKDKTEELALACMYYLDFPPKKQILQDGALEWSSAIPNNSTDLEKLLILVRRVRNNLFHGGKYNSQSHVETARNEELLEMGALILKEAMKLSPLVKRAYDGAAI